MAKSADRAAFDANEITDLVSRDGQQSVVFLLDHTVPR